MKITKATLLAVILLLLFSCSSDDEDPTPLPEVETFSLNIPNGYFQDMPSISPTARIFLTDSEGEFIGQSDLQNGEESSIEVEQNSFDLTYLSQSKILDKTIYQFWTFSNMEPNNLSFTEKAPSDAISTVGEANFVILNTNAILTDINLTQSGGSSSNIFETEFSINLKRFDDQFYASFFNESDSKYRYLWVENINPNDRDTFDYEALPILNSPQVFTFPENNRTSLSVRGENPGYQRKYLVDKSFADGITEGDFYFSTNTFEKYNVYKSITTDDYRYTTNSVSATIDYQFEIPDMSLQVDNEAMLDYTATTGGDYNHYKVTFRYENEEEDYIVFWTFYGKKKDIVNIIIPQLDMAEVIGSESFQFSDLMHQSTILEDIENIQEIEDIFYDRLDFFRQWEFDSKIRTMEQY